MRGTRRDEILLAAATLFAASGVRTSLKDIADACGILPTFASVRREHPGLYWKCPELLPVGKKAEMIK
jgi:hypothetical protein